MDGFTQPPPNNPKIAPTVDLAAADAERQQLYGPLLMADQEVKQATAGKAPVSIEGVTPLKTVDLSASLIGEKAAEEDPRVKPTEEDKKAFLASVLGGKRYQKQYQIFGNVSVLMVDRSTEEAEFVFLELKGLQSDDWDLMRERYQLAYQLREIRSTEGTTTFAPFEMKAEALKARVAEMLKLPKPLYQAVMEVGRVFDDHVDILTESALNVDFWKPGARNSQSTPPARAR